MLRKKNNKKTIIDHNKEGGKFLPTLIFKIEWSLKLILTNTLEKGSLAIH
jgi:hypothetical protein